jgi:hypothetical protein
MGIPGAKLSTPEARLAPLRRRHVIVACRALLLVTSLFASPVISQEIQGSRA